MKQVSKHVQQWRDNHHKALESLRAPTCKKTGLQLWRVLCRIENIVHHQAELYCNGAMTESEYDACKEEACNQVVKLFGQRPGGFFVNSDPRGYALKIIPDAVPEGMQTDWGGYGCLAAVIE